GRGRRWTMARGVSRRGRCAVRELCRAAAVLLRRRDGGEHSRGRSGRVHDARERAGGRDRAFERGDGAGAAGGGERAGGGGVGRGTFLAFQVPQGESVVRVEYRPMRYWSSVFAAGVAAILLGLGVRGIGSWGTRLWGVLAVGIFGN